MTEKPVQTVTVRIEIKPKAVNDLGLCVDGGGWHKAVFETTESGDVCVQSALTSALGALRSHMIDRERIGLDLAEFALLGDELYSAMVYESEANRPILERISLLLDQLRLPPDEREGVCDG